LASNNEEEAPQGASMTRRQRLHDAPSAVVPTGHTRPDGELSVASLILPPVGAANPKAWGRPLATSRTAVAEPAPVSSLSSHPIEQTAVTEALAEVILDELPEEVAEKILAPEPLAPEETRGRATEQAADETAEVEARAETAEAEAEHATVVVLPVAPVHPAPAAPSSPEEEPSGSRIAKLSRRFFAPPEEIPIPPAEERAGETPRDLQLRIQMREILEPWWTGQRASSEALAKLTEMGQKYL
jgi:hypothetical protein